MRAALPAGLDDAQASAATQGLKPLIPFGGAPFIAYTLTALADAGYTDVCVVVRPGADPVREWLGNAPARRIGLHFAVQDEPRGTAHALLAAESFAGGDDVALINADNDYPVDSLAALRAFAGPGLVAFTSSGLLGGNATADRISAYALLDVNEDGYLRDIVEKPPVDRVQRLGGAALVSMTCWRLSSRIFDACRAIPLSVRGELELPDAVRHSMRVLGERYEVVTMDAPVLDLSHPEDIPAVAESLRGRSVSF
jgi:dTDP-glucose pyrophosphorylase